MTELRREREIWKAKQGQALGPVREDEERDRAYLLTLYSGLYSELRDKDSRQQQAVTWGVTVLAGSGIVSAFAEPGRAQFVSVLAVIVLALFTAVLVTVVKGLAEDRMSMAQQLDRIHEVMGVFDKGRYYPDSSLFDPIWRGWGFDKERDVNYGHTQYLGMLLWVLFGFDAVILLSSALAKV